MGKSKVTDYMIRYIEENRMDAKSLAAHAASMQEIAEGL